jgi:hypothetical protein
MIFVRATLVDPPAQQYWLDFGSAKWIQLQGTKPSLPAYFRGTVYIPGSVTQAWLQISATGNYKLYVNDVLLDQNQFACVRPSGVYDLKQIVAPGKNVIAVAIAGGRFPGPAQLMVRGSYTVAGSIPQEFLSDLKWKVSSTPDGIINSFPWSSPALIDTTWRSVVYGVAGERFSKVQPVPFDPHVIEDVPSAKWIESEGAAQQSSFIRHLNLPWRRGESWLQVAATGSYDVTINGVPVVNQPATAETNLVGPEAPVFTVPGTTVPQSQMSKGVAPKSIVAGSLTPSFTLPPQTTPPPQAYPNIVWLRGTSSAPREADAADMTEMPDWVSIAAPLQQHVVQLVPYQVDLGLTAMTPLLTAYNVTRWMRAGDNTLQIRVRNHYGPALLFAQGHTQVNGVSVTFRTDQSWQAVTISHVGGSLVGRAAVVIADYGVVPWGPLPQVLANRQSLPGQNLSLFLRNSASIMGVLAAVGLLWLYVPKLIADIRGHDTDRLWTADALLHLPLLCGLLFLWMLSFDARIRANWCFNLPILICAAAYLLASKTLLLFASGSAPDLTDAAAVDVWPRAWHYWSVAGLAVIVLMGLAIRAVGLLDASLGHDETGLILMSWGLLKVGFPYVQAGSFTKWAATYELVPYPLALSSLIFGVTPFAYRLPSLIFGTATIGLIGWVGYRMMGWRVGLVAALIYACLPMPIFWARDGFYPSQMTCFALLTFWFFYEAIRERGLNPRFVTLSGVTFVLTYLSWEGSAFIIVSMLLSILILKWGEYDWMLDGHLWRVFATVVAIVLIQLFWRMWIGVPDYLGVVVTLSQITTPSLVFLNRLLFEPYFYLQCELFVENHFLLTLVTLIGMPFAWRKQPLLFLYISLVTMEICYTGLLAHVAPRYGFFWTPLIVLGGTGTFFYIWDSIAELPAWRTPFLFSRSVALYGGLAMLILGTNPFLLKLYRLAADPSSLHYFSRLGAAFKYDYHSSYDYVDRHAAPGDVIISDGPGAHIFFFYNGYWPSATMDSLLSNRIIYDVGYGTPIYTDKLGLPMVRNLNQLMLATAQGRSVWVMTHGGDSPEVLAFIHKRGRYVFESGGQRVWELKGTAPAPPTAPRLF